LLENLCLTEWIVKQKRTMTIIQTSATQITPSRL